MSSCWASQPDRRYSWILEGGGGGGEERGRGRVRKEDREQGRLGGSKGRRGEGNQERQDEEQSRVSEGGGVNDRNQKTQSKSFLSSPVQG